jgi:putative membrane protein
MSVSALIFRDWNANPVVLAALALATLAYAFIAGRRARWPYFAAATLLTAIALLSPLNLLAQGVLFSAHMAQHIVLLLLVPALVLLSLPASVREESALPPSTADEGLPSALRSRTSDSPRRPGALGLAVPCWLLGVGSMWFWHVPQFCDAAASSTAVHAFQTLSLLGMGAAFWWPILAPSPAQRIAPGLGIAYLFTACLACTALGIVLTLTPIQVCPIFRSPIAVADDWAQLRAAIGAGRDQQIGGLLMWLPMCLVYVAGIVLELARWLGGLAETKSALAE